MEPKFPGVASCLDASKGERKIQVVHFYYTVHSVFARFAAGEAILILAPTAARAA